MTTSYGKWSEPGVPHKGWTCVDMNDLGEGRAICEMCEIREIRYVHVMEHSEYPESLKVGCVCASNMEVDRKAAPLRERKLKNLKLRRRRWTTLSGWKSSIKGNSYIEKDGFHVVIYERRGGWSGRVRHLDSDWNVRARKVYRSESDAKIAAFDTIVWALDKQPWDCSH